MFTKWKSLFIAMLVAISFTVMPAHAQSAAGAASSSSSSSSAASAASVTNKGQLQYTPGTAFGVAPAPTATCQRTKGFGFSLPFVGVSTSSSKPDKECMFVQMLDRTVLMGSTGPAMACQLAYNHWHDWAVANDALGINCRDLLPTPVVVAPPPPPMVMAAPPAPPQVIERQVVVTRVVYRTRPVHRRVKRKPSCGCSVR